MRPDQLLSWTINNNININDIDDDDDDVQMAGSICYKWLKCLLAEQP